MGGCRVWVGQELAEAAQEGVLEAGPRGHYRTAIDRNVGMSIAREDVADAILYALTDPATVGHTLGVSN